MRAVAVLAALGSLLSLILGVSRTTFAMARDHYLPQQLSAVHPSFKTPYRAEIAVGRRGRRLAGTTDVRSAIGFSSFAVLVYYAIANASAWTLGGEDRPDARIHRLPRDRPGVAAQLGDSGHRRTSGRCGRLRAASPPINLNVLV